MTSQAPVQRHTPPPDARPPGSRLQTVANWVIIVVGILVGLHLIVADVMAFRILSELGNAFGGGPGVAPLPVDPGFGEAPVPDYSYCEEAAQQLSPEELQSIYPECGG